MLTLYGVARSRASRTLWLLNELGLPFRHVPVIQAYKLGDPGTAERLHTRSPEFLKINPNGHIPAVEDDGLILCESLAINLHLAKKAGGALAPATPAEESLMVMWSLWAATEVETPALEIQLHRTGNPQDGADPARADAAVEKLWAPFAVLDRALAPNGHLVGARFTVADLNVAEVIRYASAAPELFEAAPHVKAWLDACHARPAYKAMMEVRAAETE